MQIFTEIPIIISTHAQSFCFRLFFLSVRVFRVLKLDSIQKICVSLPCLGVVCVLQCCMIITVHCTGSTRGARSARRAAPGGRQKCETNMHVTWMGACVYSYCGLLCNALHSLTCGSSLLCTFDANGILFAWSLFQLLIWFYVLVCFNVE